MTVLKVLARKIPKTLARLTLPYKTRCTNLRFSSHLLKGRTVRIGCACGFWGDTAVAGILNFNLLHVHGYIMH